MNPTWIYARRLAGLRPHTVDLKEFARLGKFRVHPKKEIRCVMLTILESAVCRGVRTKFKKVSSMLCCSKTRTLWLKKLNMYRLASQRSFALDTSYFQLILDTLCMRILRKLQLRRFIGSASSISSIQGVSRSPNFKAIVVSWRKRKTHLLWLV